MEVDYHGVVVGDDADRTLCEVDFRRRVIAFMCIGVGIGFPAHIGEYAVAVDGYVVAHEDVVDA